MINRQRCKMEHSAQDRQFKSKIEEDWMIMNINTILLTIAMYEIINLRSIGFQGNKLEKKNPVITRWTDQKLAEKKFNAIAEGRPGTSAAQHLYDTGHEDRG